MKDLPALMAVMRNQKKGVNKMNERYLSVMEVSQRLNFCYNTVWGWVKKGKLKSYSFNGGYRITERDLNDFIKKSKVIK